jgi:heme/copper-type cytochrome/quinol oxidase subunit 2
MTDEAENMRRCNVCKYSLTLEQFTIDKKGVHTKTCNTCCIKTKEYSEAHKEAIAERQQEYRERNKESIAQKDKERKQRNKEQLAAQTKNTERKQREDSRTRARISREE